MGRFETTRWSVVLQARGRPDAARAAMETLCRTYRPPVLAYVRRHVGARDVAEDLTQAFFARFLEQAWHARADPARGRFRSFLLTALKRFLLDMRVEAAALKRGGGLRFESLDAEGAPAVAGSDNPEREFDRVWARSVLAAAFTRLRTEAEHANKLALFERLSEFLAEPPDALDYERAAAELGLRQNTLAVAVCRLRRRLRELVLDELTATTVCRVDLAAELQALRAALGASGADIAESQRGPPAAPGGMH